MLIPIHQPLFLALFSPALLSEKQAFHFILSSERWPTVCSQQIEEEHCSFILLRIYDLIYQ
jgi:hypothetical protein